MILRNIIFWVSVLVAHASALFASDNKLPWNTVFIDVSWDIVPHDKAGRSEMQLLISVVDQMSSHFNDGDSVSVFAAGRAVVPFKTLLDDSRNKFDYSRSCTGDGTHIYDAMLSVIGTAADVPQRLLVITNGLDNGSSFHHRTAAKILKSKGIVVDGVCVYLPADSVAIDSVYSPKPLLDNDFRDFIESTGGKFLLLKDTQDAQSTLQLLIENAKSEVLLPSGFKHGYDDAILNKTLQRIVHGKLN